MLDQIRRHAAAATATLFAIAALFSASAARANSAFNPNACQDDEEAPDLTVDMIRRYTDGLASLFEVTLTEKQRADCRQFLNGYWQRDEAEDIRQVLGDLKFLGQFAQMSAEEREWYRRAYVPVILLGTIKDAARGKEQAKWLLELYYAAHPLIAKGYPPMTEKMADTVLELNDFLHSDIRGKAASRQSDSERAKLRRAVAADYGKSGPQEQMRFVDALARMGAFRQQWGRMSEGRKEEIRLAFRDGGSVSAAARQQVAAGLDTLQAKMNVLAWNAFTGNMHTIYGGPRWDSGAGRWVNDPGACITL